MLDVFEDLSFDPNLPTLSSAAVALPNWDCRDQFEHSVLMALHVTCYI